jgi:curved DNA-binding protein
MNDRPQFVDYYSILQVSPTCDPKTLETAYHRLAKTFHPDHSGEADTTQFNSVTEAYRVLRNPEQRTEYDVLFRNHNKQAWFEANANRDLGVDEKDALSDADAHARILMFLYKNRRENAQSAGVVGFYLQEMLNCSDEEYDFHRWYLKQKGFIEVTEHGTVAITVQGIDQVISLTRTTAEKLLISQSASTSG